MLGFSHTAHRDVARVPVSFSFGKVDVRAIQKNELELEKEHWSCHSSGRRPGQNMVDARRHPPAEIQRTTTGCAVRCVLSGPLISLARTARPQCTSLQAQSSISGNVLERLAVVAVDAIEARPVPAACLATSPWPSTLSKHRCGRRRH